MITQELKINMGPQHPSTHGVLRLVLNIDGEKVRKAEPRVGYLHRGIEKLSEYGSYQQVITHIDRLDYISAITNEFAYTRTVEKLLGVRIPERAEYVRTIVAEMQRISSHLLWLATHALDIGAMTVFLYTFRERETILDLFEELTGARLNNNYMRIGGVSRDLSSFFIDTLYKFCDEFPAHIEEYDTLIRENRIWHNRTRGVGVISAEEAVSYGLSGPTLRGSGVNWDIRKAEPYGVYDKVEWEVPLGENGDVYDRYWIRVEELHQSTKIIRQCLDQLPEGPILIDDPKIVSPTKEKMNMEIESLIHQFKLMTEGFRVPEGEVYCATEVPKGELGFYLVSDGSSRPYRLKIRAPSFVHLGAFDRMVRGGFVADVIAVIGTIDIVLGECDR
ncbi:MAG: NADH dehydrogenase (quinone) subunit D [Deltaproteobacteria bacterium]|nr:NADH dehydrogenase (quinone) subunit D [Deltaproteobacteria bacterium]